LKWTPDVIIAAGVIVASFTMRCFGINAEVWAMSLLAAGWVFGGAFHSKRKVLHERNQADDRIIRHRH
jgi:hypothetical protein